MAPGPRFSQHLQQTIESFAASMQFPSTPSPSADGGYVFQFERSGTLSLLPSGDGRYVVMTLGRKPLNGDESFMRRFFLQATLDSLTGLAMHAGMTADGMFCYATRIPLESFDLPTLEQNLNMLISAHDAAQ